MLITDHDHKQLLDKLMKNKRINTTSEEYEYHELVLMRSVFLAHLFAGKVPPGDILRYARRFSEVTRWEELLCAAIYPKESKLVAIVNRRQTDGYSGILRRHGSIEYVRFFIDWGDRRGFRALGLSHFKVCDAALDEGQDRYPFCHLVSLDFDVDRYWDAVVDGYQPKIRAVLSWNQVPEMDAEFVPVFGNRVDSRIRVESERELMEHFEMPPGGSMLKNSPRASCSATTI
jgi:hypothetical protein